MVHLYVKENNHHKSTRKISHQKAEGKNREDKTIGDIFELQKGEKLKRYKEHTILRINLSKHQKASASCSTSIDIGEQRSLIPAPKLYSQHRYAKP